MWPSSLLLLLLPEPYVESPASASIVSVPAASASASVVAPSITVGSVSLSPGVAAATGTVAAPTLTGDFPDIVLTLSAVQIYVPGVKAAQIIGGGF